MTLTTPMLILDDCSRDDLVSHHGTPWRSFSNQAIVDISQATGAVRRENQSRFIQVARDHAPDGRTVDASAWAGVVLVARGGERYGIRLRPPGCVRPWQSCPAGFVAAPNWPEIRLPFEWFEPYRLTKPLDVRQLRRLRLVAIGRAFHADLAISAVGLYR